MPRKTHAKRKEEIKPGKIKDANLDLCVCASQFGWFVMRDIIFTLIRIHVDNSFIRDSD